MTLEYRDRLRGLTCWGRLFPIQAAATGKAQSPMCMTDRYYWLIGQSDADIQIHSMASKCLNQTSRHRSDYCISDRSACHFFTLQCNVMYMYNQITTIFMKNAHRNLQFLIVFLCGVHLYLKCIDLEQLCSLLHVIFTFVRLQNAITAFQQMKYNITVSKILSNATVSRHRYHITV